MKPFRVSLFRFIAVTAIVIMFTGCAYIIKSSEIPLLQTGSPLKGIKPKTFAFKEFKDVRGTEPSLVLRSGGHDIILDMPAATVVATAIKKELERNGHTCVMDTPESKANFVIEGAVYKYWFTFNQSAFSSVKGTGNVAVKLTISAVSPNGGVLTKNYEGEYHPTSGPPLKYIEKILNQALLAMIKEISTDPELIAFIEK